MPEHATYLAAFIEGIVAFLTPCTLPMVPLYLTYMTGVSAADIRGADVKRARLQVILAALAFIAGFTTIFVAMGALAELARPFLKGQYFQIASGIFIIFMGLNFLGVFQIGFFNREKRFQAPQTAGMGGAYIMGAAFAAGWSPCLGPILSTILGMAVNSETSGQGALLLGIFSLGLGLPFLIAAAALDFFLGFLTRFRPYMGTVEKISGVFLIIIGFAFVYGGLDFAGGWAKNFFMSVAPPN